MIYRIHGESKNGIEDYIIIEAETIEEIQKIAKYMTERRNWKNCWSEEIK